MKNLLLTLFALLLVAGTTWGQSEKSIVKSFRHEGSLAVQLAMEGDLEVTHWDETSIRLEVAIEGVNINENILKALLKAGRYSCATETKDGAMIITMPKAHKELVLRGTKQIEKYRFKITVPKGVVVEQVPYDEEIADLF